MNPLRISRIAHRQLISRWHLRHLTSYGSRPRVWGRPRIVNRGLLTVGERFMMRSICLRTELVANDNAWLTIGDRCYIHDGTSIAAYYQVAIGNRVLIGRDCLISDSDQHGLEVERRSELPEPQPVFIGNDVWLGDRVTVLKGTNIQTGSVIGAGSVVTHDIPPMSIAVGNPARVIGAVPIAHEAINAVKGGAR